MELVGYFCQALTDFTLSLLRSLHISVRNSSTRLNADFQCWSKHWIIEFSMGKLTALLFLLLASLARERPGRCRRVALPPVRSQGFPGALSGTLTVPRRLRTASGSCTPMSDFTLIRIKVLSVGMSRAFQSTVCLSCSSLSVTVLPGC